jgi:MFS family permease
MVYPGKCMALSNDKDRKEMRRTPIFYLLITLLTCGAVSGLMCIVLVSPLAQRMIGMSNAAAIAAISLLARFNVFGRIMAGWLSDKFDRINTLTLACALSAIGLYQLGWYRRCSHILQRHFCALVHSWVCFRDLQLISLEQKTTA